MKIICAGYWKTGTKSLSEALRILGYRVYDYDDQFFELGELWDKFYDGTVTDTDIYSSLKDIDVLIDGPVVAFWEEIHKIFPSAKIILTTRDEDSWYRSYKEMHNAISTKVLMQYVISILIPAGYKFVRRVGALVRYCEGVAGPLSLRPPDNPRLYKLKFRKHNSYIQHRAPKDKLLVHSFKDGWGPLCLFLGHDVPDLPYPYKNKMGTDTTYDLPTNAKLIKLIRQAEIMLYIVIAFSALVLYWLIFV